jgi:hypothetical protein
MNGAVEQITRIAPVGGRLDYGYGGVGQMKSLVTEGISEGTLKHGRQEQR